MRAGRDPFHKFVKLGDLGIFPEPNKPVVNHTKSVLQQPMIRIKVNEVLNGFGAGIPSEIPFR